MPDDLSQRWPMEGQSLRLPPSNIRAEQSLLGALLANNHSFERCATLRPEHFADPVNGRIYEAIARRIEHGRSVDAVTLKAEFDNSGILDEVGGTSYLSQILAAMVAPHLNSEYAATITDTWVRRQVIAIAEKLARRAFGTEDVAETTAIIAEAHAALEAAAAGAGPATASTLDAAMDAALAGMERARWGAVCGLSTGFQSFDMRLGGLEPGLVYVIAGRPGTGKSSLGHQIAVNIARNGYAVHEWSLEMSATQLGRRTLATAARVPIMALKTGRLNIGNAEAVVLARKEMAGLPILIDDAGGHTAAQIVATTRAMQRKHKTRLIMIDHLNLVRGEDVDARHGGTWTVERASAAVLGLAKTCECPVLLLAQLNRGVESREDKRPVLSDLRQAGAIEQDAYAVGFVYRAEYYLGGEPEQKGDEAVGKLEQRRQEWLDRCALLHGRAELIWGKVRDGEPGTDHLTFDGPTATFGEPDNG